MRLHRTSLRGQGVLLVVAAVAATFAVHRLALFAVLERQLHATTVQSMASLAATLSAQVDQVMADSAGSLRAMAADPRLTGSDPETVERALAELRAYGQRFDGLSLIDLRGRLVAIDRARPDLRGLDLSDRDYVRAILQGADRYFSDAYEARTGNRVVAVSVAVRDGPDLRGVLTGTLHLGRDNLLTRLLRPQPVGRTGTAAVVDRRGQVIYGPSGPEGEARLPEAVVEGLRRGGAGSGTVAGRDGAPVLVAYHPVPRTGWGVAVLLPVAEAAEPVRQVARVSAAAAVVLAALIAAMAAVAARRMTAPLDRLVEAAQRVSAGDLRVQVPTDGPEEVARLAAAFNRMLDELRVQQAELQVQATTDPLTGLPHRGAFREQLQLRIDRARRGGRPVALLVVDVDDFKSYNDAFGHPAGDDALRQIAGILRTSVRARDWAARYGGEEFAVILPDADPLAAARVAERVRAAIAAHPFPYGHLTASIGVAVFPDHAGDAEALVAAADRAMYEAKKRGKNRWAVCGGAGGR